MPERAMAEAKPLAGRMRSIAEGGAVQALASVAIVLTIAVWLRAPELQNVPHLTDETGEVLWAYDIAYSGARPLTHTDSYNGPLWPYLMATAMRLFGATARLPRQMALAFGLVSVALTLLLGRALARTGNRAAGLIAGTLVATAFTHALVNSRVAWSNCATPVWTTLCALLMVAAVRSRRGPLLVVAGLVGGLALHSHPSVLVFLIALGIWFLAGSSRRAWLREPWPWLAMGAAVLAYSPVIYHNIATGFDTLDQASESRNIAGLVYPIDWMIGVLALLGQLGRSMAGGFDTSGPDDSWILVSWLYAMGAVGATVGLALRADENSGRRLPAIVLLVAALSLPLVNRNWQGLLEARYLGFIWPMAFAAAGSLAAEAWAKWGTTGRAALSVMLLLTAGLPLARVRSFESAAAEQSFDNRRLWEQLGATTSLYDDGYRIFVDEGLKQVGWRAGGQPRRAVEYLLTMDGVAYTRAPEDKINHFLSTGPAGRYVLFLAGDTAQLLGSRYDLVPIDTEPRPGEEPWGLYVSKSP